MVKSALLMKSLRDMKHSLAQFVSIFIMVMVAAAIIVSLDSCWLTIQNQSQRLFEQTAVADYWVSTVNPSERDLWRLEKVEGVAQAEKRFVIDADVDIAGTPTLRIYAARFGHELDKPYITDGALKSRGGAVLDKQFAQANDIHIGDKLRLKVNDTWVQVRVEALGYSSEHIYSLKDASTMRPDPKSYGFIAVNEEALRPAYGGMTMSNQISVRLAEGADERAVQQGIAAIYGNDLIGIMTHEDVLSISSTESTIVQFQSLATVFPVMFFVVAALITFTTMMRLVEDQRSQIGILKALGYRKKTIIWHYTSYGLSIGILGVVVATLLGPPLLGRLVLNMLKPTCVLPDYSMSIYWPNVVLSLVIVAVSTGGISCWSSLRLMGEMPAMLLRPKEPKRGKHILLEKVAVLWERLSFRTKLVVRNIAENKLRMFMSIFGIMGCTGLIIGAFALTTMIKDMAASTYEQMYTYDQKLILEDGTDRRFIDNTTVAGEKQGLEETGLQIVTAEGRRKMISVSITTAQSPLITLYGEDGQAVELPSDGVLMSRKLAEILGVQPGDQVKLKLMTDDYVMVPVRGLYYISSGQGIYMRDDYWASLGGTYTPTALLVKWAQAPDQTLLASSRIEKIMTRAEQKDGFAQNTKALNQAVLILITAGSILALVVIYNMSILNFHERIRDLSTLRVLGYHHKEISPLVLAENIISALAGILCGIPIGWLILYKIAMVFGDDFDMHVVLKPWDITLSALITLLFVVIVNILVARKMRQIDMLEALKSVE